MIELAFGVLRAEPNNLFPNQHIFKGEREHLKLHHDKRQQPGPSFPQSCDPLAL